MQTINTTVGQNIRTARRSLKLKQAELAATLGTIQPRVSLLERGAADIRLLELQRVATALGTTVTALLDGAE